MKYIVFYSAKRAHAFPVVFADFLVHADVSQCILRSAEVHGAEYRPVSAGEVQFGARGLTCFGKSETLNLESHPVEDNALLRMVDYGGCHTYKPPTTNKKVPR